MGTKLRTFSELIYFTPLPAAAENLEKTNPNALNLIKCHYLLKARVHVK
jgi:hypothetical protein